MAWELRRNHPYYYRSVRVKGRVVKQYLGKGQLATEFSQALAAKQRMLRTRQASLRNFREQLQHYERIIDPFWRYSEAVLKRALEDAGYHYHRGEWRRRR